MKVFKAYGNQYDTKENAQWIIDNHGNPLEKVKECEYNEMESLFTIKNNEQIEIERN